MILYLKYHNTHKVFFARLYIYICNLFVDMYIFDKLWVLKIIYSKNSDCNSKL